MNPEQIESQRKKANQRRIEYLQRKIQRDKTKFNSTLSHGISKVKQHARKDTWSTAHSNCFRASFSTDNKAESDKHRNRKYTLWCYYRKLGYTVFTELILENGKRPDLIIVGNNGSVFIIEIVESESDESIEKKKEYYPFPIQIERV